MIMTIQTSQQSMKKVPRSKTVLKDVTLTKPVLPLTLVQKMDTVMHTSRILLQTMLEVELKTGNVLLNFQSQLLVRQYTMILWLIFNHSDGLSCLKCNSYRLTTVSYHRQTQACKTQTQAYHRQTQACKKRFHSTMLQQNLWELKSPNSRLLSWHWKNRLPQ
jgi:hypothetical protein